MVSHCNNHLGFVCSDVLRAGLVRDEAMKDNYEHARTKYSRKSFLDGATEIATITPTLLKTLGVKIYRKMLLFPLWSSSF